MAENTLVIFVSDNGPHEEGNHKVDFFNSNGHLRGKKRDLYEGGIKTPFHSQMAAEDRAGYLLRIIFHVSGIFCLAFVNWLVSRLLRTATESHLLPP